MGGHPSGQLSGHGQGQHSRGIASEPSSCDGQFGGANQSLMTGSVPKLTVHAVNKTRAIDTQNQTSGALRIVGVRRTMPESYTEQAFSARLLCSAVFPRPRFLPAYHAGLLTNTGRKFNGDKPSRRADPLRCIDQRLDVSLFRGISRDAFVRAYGRAGERNGPLTGRKNH